MSASLVIRSSSIHAAGCYTLKPVRRRAIVCEYAGPRFSKKEADKRYRDRIVTYLFSLGEDDIVIDGFGTAMFINHSCDPNCESAEQDGRIVIRTLRPIAAGEELTYEYNLHDSDDEIGDCHCGAKECRGTMFSAAEVTRRERKARRQARIENASVTRAR